MLNGVIAALEFWVRIVDAQALRGVEAIVIEPVKDVKEERISSILVFNFREFGDELLERSELTLERVDQCLAGFLELLGVLILITIVRIETFDLIADAVANGVVHEVIPLERLKEPDERFGVRAVVLSAVALEALDGSEGDWTI